MGVCWIRHVHGQCHRHGDVLCGIEKNHVSSRHGPIGGIKYPRQWYPWMGSVSGAYQPTMDGGRVMSCRGGSVGTTPRSFRYRRSSNSSFAPFSNPKELRVQKTLLLDIRSSRFEPSNAFCPVCASTHHEDDALNDVGLICGAPPLPYKYCAILAYDGTRYRGFQLQNEFQYRRAAPTIQGKLEQALTKFLAVTRDKLGVQGAGRTDAGVHARGQAIHFFSPRILTCTSEEAGEVESTWYREDKDAGDEVALKNNLPPYEYNMASSMSHHGSVEDCFENINSFTTRSLSQFSHDLWRRPPKSISALNSLLPEDVRVKSIRRVPVNFNVRFCIGKIYSYTYHLDPIEDPFLLRYRCSLRDGWRLDLDAMAAAASLFEGTHDFGFFSSKSRDGRIRSSIRTIQRCQIVPVIDGIKMEVHGTGFLYKQVRHMAGAILAVGRGRLNLSDISRMLEGGTALQQQSEERHAYTVADARGLCLERVFLPRIEDPDSHMKYD